MTGTGTRAIDPARLDAHVHFWRYDPREYAWIDDSMPAIRRDFTPDDLRPLLDAAGIGGCVAVQARSAPDETAWLLSLADRYAWIAGVVGWIDLLSPGVEERLATLARAPALVGVRHVVQEEPPGFMARADFRRGLAALEQFGLAYDILIRAPQLDEAVDLVRAIPAQRFVLDHLGKPDIRGNGFAAWARGVRRLADIPGVRCKLSGLVTEADRARWRPDDLRPYLDTALEWFGADRLMFGSDWPVCTLAAPYGTVAALVDDATRACSAGDRALIFGGTARSFWKLRESST